MTMAIRFTEKTMNAKFRNFLLTETDRNIANHRIFIRFLTRALNAKPETIIAHHIIYMSPGELPNEIPSADTLIFDHALMTAVFGDRAPLIMQTLAQRDVDTRDKVLNDFLDMLDAEETQKAQATA